MTLSLDEKKSVNYWSNTVAAGALRMRIKELGLSKGDDIRIEVKNCDD